MLKYLLLSVVLGVSAAHAVSPYRNPALSDKWVLDEYIREIINLSEESRAERLVKLIGQITSEPKNAKAFTGRAMIKYIEKDFDGAVADFSQAIKLQPNWPDDYYYRAKIYEHQKRYKQAVADFDKILEIDKKASFVLYFKMVLLVTKTREYEKALECSSTLLSTNPNDPETWYYAGLIHKEMGNNKRAIAYFEQTLKLSKHLHLARINMADCYAIVNNTDMAMTQYGIIFQQARHLPKSVPTADLALAYNNYGNIFMRKGDRRTAYEYYMKSLLRNSDNPNAFTNLGNYYLLERKYDAALEHYKSALKYDQNRDEIYVNMGTLYVNLNKLKQAEDCFLKAVKVNPKMYQAHIKLSALYEAQGDLVNALKHYKKMSSLCSNERDKVGIDEKIRQLEKEWAARRL